jgi:putative peptidoglycan lipid II flippase
MSIGRSSFWFAAGTLLSRFSGLARDSIVAGVFGASMAMDAFVVAFRIPNLLRDMLAEGALSSSFTKVYSSLKQTDQERAAKLLSAFLLLTALLGATISILGIIFAPSLVDLMTMSNNGNAGSPAFRENAVLLTQVLFPFIGMAMISSVMMGVLHQSGGFFLSGMSPLGQNLGYILGALVLAPIGIRSYLPENPDIDVGILALSVGVLLGMIASLILEWIGVGRIVLDAFKRFGGFSSLWTDDIRKVITIMIPAAIAASAAPINLTISTNFATSLPEGTITSLNYAFRLLQLPVGIFAVAIAAAALPALSRSLAQSKNRVNAQVSNEMQYALELVCWLTVPCMIFLFVNHTFVIQLLFQHMSFTSDDAMQTGQALFCYSFGLVSYGLIKVLSSFYYAIERTTYAMYVSFASIAVSAAGNYLLVERFQHAGLATTTSISLAFNSLALLSGLWAQKVQWNWSRLRRSAGILSLFCAVALAVQIVAVLLFDQTYFTDAKLNALMILSINTFVIACVFLPCACWITKMSPAHLLQIVRKRGRK